MSSETGHTQAVSDGSPRSDADTRSDPTRPPPATQPGRRLLVWDAPNIDMVIGTLILRRKPTLKERPKAEMLARWLLERCEGSDVAEGCIFANATGANFNAILGWTEFLRQMGFRVFLKPKASEDSDVDDNIVEHIEDRFEAGDLREVVVMTHDGANLGDLAGGLIAAGVTVTALVFPEHANSLCAVAGIQVVDLESVTGLFETRLPRVSFATLPDEGMWLEPLAPLGTVPGPFPTTRH